MFAAVVSDRDSLREELRQVRAERNELQERLTELCAAIRARQDAEAEVRRLYRERSIARARAAERPKHDAELRMENGTRDEKKSRRSPAA
jgi:hypothetical protein